MEAQLYESLLKKHPLVNSDTEIFWDIEAKEFRDRQKKSAIDLSEKVTELLLRRGLLKGFDVLDIGGGTGRLAVPFAAHANEVTIADISTQMLEYAKEDAESAERENLQYVKLGWEEADLKKLGWEKHFDLVFTSMCPATRSLAGINKMSEASKGWCQINQQIETTDNISQMLMQDLEIGGKYDPHNDRDAVQGFFNLLWIQGYEPEITYLKETSQQVLSVEELYLRYLNRFRKLAETKEVKLKQLLEDYAKSGGVTVENKITLAMILWKA